MYLGWKVEWHGKVIYLGDRGGKKKDHCKCENKMGFDVSQYIFVEFFDLYAGGSLTFGWTIFCRIGQSKSTLPVEVFIFYFFCVGLGAEKLGRGCMQCDIIEMHGEEMSDLEN